MDHRPDRLLWVLDVYTFVADADFPRTWSIVADDLFTIIGIIGESKPFARADVPDRVTPTISGCKLPLHDQVRFEQYGEDGGCGTCWLGPPCLRNAMMDWLSPPERSIAISLCLTLVRTHIPGPKGSPMFNVRMRESDVEVPVKLWGIYRRAPHFYTRARPRISSIAAIAPHRMSGPTSSGTSPVPHMLHPQVPLLVRTVPLSSRELRFKANLCASMRQERQASRQMTSFSGQITMISYASALSYP